MPDQDTTPDDAATAPEDTTPDAPGATETAQGEQDDPKPKRPASDDLKADLAKERRQRQALEKRLKDIEERDLTELQRAQKQAQEASQQLEELRRESLRRDIALKHELPPDLVSHITGTTEEEMAASAGVLARYAKPKAPRPDPTQGSRAGQQPTDMNALLRQAAGLR